MGIEQDPAGAGSSAAASAATAAASYPPNQPPPSATPAQQQYPPAMQQQTYPPAPQGFSSPQGYGAPQGVPPHQHNYGNPPNYYAQQQPQPLPQVLPTVVTGRPPIVSIISPDDMKKIRKMQWINFGCTMVQLVCSLAIILMVRNNLSRITRGGAGLAYVCYAATPDQASTCEYAYSLASISIFFCFILSLMQCLTMDCCGMGRAVEAGFDAAACAWWIAGGITLGMRATEANAAGIPQQAARNAVVALCWLSATMFLALLVTNMVLIKKLGKAYKAAHQQLQQHLTAYPAQTQMVQMGAPAPAGPGGAPYPPQPGMPPPAGMYGTTAPGAAAAAPYPQQPQQQWGPPAGYPTTPPNAGAAAATGPNAV